MNEQIIDWIIRFQRDKDIEARAFKRLLLCDD